MTNTWQDHQPVITSHSTREELNIHGQWLGWEPSSPESSGPPAAAAAAAEEHGILRRKPALCRACVCSPNAPTLLKDSGLGMCCGW